MNQRLFLLLSIYLLGPILSDCQTDVGVWATPRNSNESSLKLYTEYYAGAIACGLKESTAINSNAPSYLIIGDTSCDGKFSSYVVIKYGIRYFAEKGDFKNTPEINKNLKIIAETYPTIQQRKELALSKYASYFENEKVEDDKRNKKELDSLKKELDQTLKTYRDENLVLWKWDWAYTNEYSKFVGVDITVINPYKQKIKYIWFTFIAFNPVGDPVKHGMNGKSEVIMKGVGPIEYGGYGSYTFEDVFYSGVIDKMRVKQIKVQFFDGTYKIITKPKDLNAD